MGLLRCIRLFSECFKLAGCSGLISCAKYLFGLLRLPEIPVKSSELDGDVYV